MGSNQLSTLLVDERVVSPEKLEEAYQRQVLFGGRLGTNLLEIGALDEATLLLYLSRAMGLPWADRELIGQVDWEAVELLDLATIRGFRLLPVRFDGSVVRALVTDALPPDRLRELKARIGHPINQYITSEFRFDALLEKLFDVPLSARLRRLEERFPLEQSPLAAVLPHAALAEAELELDDVEVELEPVESDAPVALVAPVEPPHAVSAAARPSVSVIEPTFIGAPVRSASQPAAPRAERPAPVSPAAFDALWTAFERTASTSESRDEILAHFARVASAVGERCMLLLVGQERLRGLLVESRQPLSVDVRTLTVRLRSDSELSRVVEGGAYFRGPADRGELQALYAKLQVPPPHEALVLPVRLGPRVALLAVVDAGEAPLPDEPTRLFDSVYLASEALERAFLAHRQRGARAPAAADSAPALAPVVVEEPVAAVDEPVVVVDEPPVVVVAVPAPQGGDTPLPPAVVLPPADEAPLPRAVVLAPGDDSMFLDDAIPEVDIELEPLVGDSFDLSERPRTLNDLVELEPLGGPTAGPESTDVAWRGAAKGEAFARPVTLGGGGRPAVALSDSPPRLAPGDSSLGPEARGGFASVAHSDVFVLQALGAVGVADPELDELALIDDVEPLVPGRGSEPQAEVAPDAASLSPAELEQWAERLDDRDRAVQQQARAVLAQPSSRAVAALMRRFPGRLRLDRFHYERDTPPPQRHSHVLEALVAQGLLAEGALCSMLRSTSADERFYALLTLSELRSEAVLARLGELVFDKDPQVRALAVRMIRTRRNHPAFEQFIAHLLEVLEQGDDERRLELAARALGQTRSIDCLPRLIPLVDHANRRVSEAAREACMMLSLENPGSSARKWERWFAAPESQSASRIQRLADAMVHREREVRELAAEELNEFPGMMINYHPDAHRRERQRAREAFLDWVQAHPEQVHRSTAGTSGPGHTMPRLGASGSGTSSARGN